MDERRRSRVPFLILSALGVVFGDSGTSPLYAVLHQQIVPLSLSILDVPSVGDKPDIEVHRLPHGFHRMIARYGFVHTPNVMEALAAARRQGLDWRDEDTTFYPAHLTLFANDRIGMSAWRDKRFIFLSRNARRATNFFRVPADRVVEIGIQLEL